MHPRIATVHSKAITLLAKEKNFKCSKRHQRLSFMSTRGHFACMYATTLAPSPHYLYYTHASLLHTPCNAYHFIPYHTGGMPGLKTKRLPGAHEWKQRNQKTSQTGTTKLVAAKTKIGYMRVAQKITGIKTKSLCITMSRRPVLPWSAAQVK